jgi:hypothetical protein
MTKNPHSIIGEASALQQCLARVVGSDLGWRRRLWAQRVRPTDRPPYLSPPKTMDYNSRLRRLRNETGRSARILTTAAVAGKGRGAPAHAATIVATVAACDEEQRFWPFFSSLDALPLSLVYMSRAQLLVRAGCLIKTPVWDEVRPHSCYEGRSMSGIFQPDQSRLLRTK